MLPGMSGHRQWVYPRSITGRFQRIHRITGLLLILVLVVAPWIRIGELPMVRIDLPARRVALLGQVFTASDGFILVLLAFLAAFGLFWFTAMFGRLWCGYVCPQTVFLEEWVRPVERWFEGDRGQRMRRDAAPWSFDKFWRKAGKLTTFALLALFVGASVQSWFAGPVELWTGRAGPVDYTVVGVIATGLFLDWAWFREQLCIYLCPYARFQSALTDDESLVVAYDAPRAEPRAKGREAAKEGRCIDCMKCVQVCPMGIDIRNGFQLECINCARCVDACEDVMGRLGHPSLVRYTTIAAEEGRRTRLVRPRTVVYGVLLTALMALLIMRVSTNEAIEVSVQRAPGTLFQVDEDGFVRNTYLLRVDNHDPLSPRAFTIEVVGLPGGEVVVPPLEIPPLEGRTVPLIVRAPADALDQPSTPLVVEVRSEASSIRRDATFRAPRRGEG